MSHDYAAVQHREHWHNHKGLFLDVLLAICSWLEG